MITLEELAGRISVDHTTVSIWVAAGWLRQSTQQGYSEVDVARAQLIRELRTDLGINDEGVDLALALIDQVHGLTTAVEHLQEALVASTTYRR
jgi:chaperone modulatory protein CbpM